MTCPQPSSGTAEPVECASVTVTQTVFAQGCCYNPEVVHAQVNDVLEFQLVHTEQTHTATAGPPGCIGEWDLRGGNKCLRLLQAGTFPFHCEFHAGMTGAIIVSE